MIAPTMRVEQGTADEIHARLPPCFNAKKTTGLLTTESDYALAILDAPQRV
jgi:hypothetical protein